MEEFHQEGSANNGATCLVTIKIKIIHVCILLMIRLPVNLQCHDPYHNLNKPFVGVVHCLLYSLSKTVDISQHAES